MRFLILWSFRLPLLSSCFLLHNQWMPSISFNYSPFPFNHIPFMYRYLLTTTLLMQRDPSHDDHTGQPAVCFWFSLTLLHLPPLIMDLPPLHHSYRDGLDAPSYHHLHVGWVGEPSSAHYLTSSLIASEIITEKYHQTIKKKKRPTQV